MLFLQQESKLKKKRWEKRNKKFNLFIQGNYQ